MTNVDDLIAAAGAHLEADRPAEAEAAARRVLADPEGVIAERHSRFENRPQCGRRVFAKLAAVPSVQGDFPPLSRHASSLVGTRCSAPEPARAP